MSYIKETIKCPECGEKIRCKIYHELTCENLEMIYNLEFLTITCEKCKKNITLNYDVSYKCDDFHVFYLTDNYEISDKFPISRITKTHDDFKEKILILSDGLSDFVISFLKCFIYDDMKLNEYPDFKELRYNEKSDDSITFYAMGMDKYLAVPIDFYNNLLKKSKIKKVNDAIIVDEVTFRKYMKVK